MNENINENRNDEILTNEELEVMNNNLKNVENVTLPESLAPEKIAEKLENIPQNVTEFTEVAPEKKKRKKRKILFRSLSAAAAVIVAITSVAIVKPWNKIPVKIEDSIVNQEPATPEDYTEIEQLFADYAKKYNSYQNDFRYNLNFFRLFSISIVCADSTAAATRFCE